MIRTTELTEPYTESEKENINNKWRSIKRNVKFPQISTSRAFGTMPLPCFKNELSNTLNSEV